MLKVGDKATQFSLHSDTGAIVALKDLAGKYVVLFFFPKANTPG
jgi:thioredoxin-dependent peroxiredoxin